jgi:hypothetical protein
VYSITGLTTNKTTMHSYKYLFIDLSIRFILFYLFIYGIISGRQGFSHHL